MRILLIAYACEPHEGSEPGAGWAFARMLASLGEVQVLTRENNRPQIEEGSRSTPEIDRLTFTYVDLPGWARFWKRGRIGIQPYYLLWQRRALRTARSLHEEQPFDLVWHVTLANTWLGSVGSAVGPPFVWGPIGGGVDVPFRMAPALGFRGAAYEGVRWLIRRIFRYANPLARVGWRGARLILVQNGETERWLPRRYRGRCQVFCNVALEPVTPAEAGPDDVPAPLADDSRASALRTAFFAGNLLPLKGLSLAIAALTYLPSWRLVIAGSGPDRPRLERAVVRAGVADRVRFLGRVPRDRVQELLRGADAFVFPSLRDDAGWAVAEAARAGIPIVCLDRGGPPLIAGGGVEVTTPRATALALARAIERVEQGAVQGIDVTIAARRDALMRILEESGLDGLSAGVP